MATFKDKGIVLREYASGERDKNLVLLLKERGRVTVFAKGAGGPVSKFGVSACLFAFSEFVIYEGASFMSLAQCQIIDNFYKVRDDFERLCHASHVLELLDHMILPAMPAQDALLIAYLALDALCGERVSPRLVITSFTLKLLQLEGFQPSSRFCASCRTSISGQAYFADQGVVCLKCAKTTAVKTPLSKAAAYALDYILNTEPAGLFSFTLAEDPARELAAAMRIFRDACLEGAAFNSVKLLETYFDC